MRFRVRDLFISTIPVANQLNYPCAPDTVCGTITNTGPDGHTCQQATHCCYTDCNGYTAASGVREHTELNDDFLAMLREEIQAIQSKSKEAVYDAPEPESREDLEVLESSLKLALEDVRSRLNEK